MLGWGDRKCVGNVSNSDILPVQQHPKDVETVRHGVGAEAVDPDPGCPAQLPLLAVVDCIDRAAEFLPAAGLDLDEGDDVSCAHYQVYIAPPRAKSMLHDVPSLPFEPARGDTFSQQSECLSLVCHARQHNANVVVDYHRFIANVRIPLQGMMYG